MTILRRGPTLTGLPLPHSPLPLTQLGGPQLLQTLTFTTTLPTLYSSSICPPFPPLTDGHTLPVPHILPIPLPPCWPHIQASMDRHTWTHTHDLLRAVTILPFTTQHLQLLLYPTHLYLPPLPALPLPTTTHLACDIPAHFSATFPDGGHTCCVVTIRWALL